MRLCEAVGQVLQTSGKVSDLLLVNIAGKRIKDQVPDLISRLNKKVGLHKAYTNRDARRAYETWSQNLPVKERVADYIAHSAETAKARYTAPDRSI